MDFIKKFVQLITVKGVKEAKNPAGSDTERSENTESLEPEIAPAAIHHPKLNRLKSLHAEVTDLITKFDTACKVHKHGKGCQKLLEREKRCIEDDLGDLKNKVSTRMTSSESALDTQKRRYDRTLQLMGDIGAKREQIVEHGNAVIRLGNTKSTLERKLNEKKKEAKKVEERMMGKMQSEIKALEAAIPRLQMALKKRSDELESKKSYYADLIAKDQDKDDGEGRECDVTYQNVVAGLEGVASVAQERLNENNKKLKASKAEYGAVLKYLQDREAAKRTVGVSA